MSRRILVVDDETDMSVGLGVGAGAVRSVHAVGYALGTP